MKCFISLPFTEFCTGWFGQRSWRLLWYYTSTYQVPNELKLRVHWEGNYMLLLWSDIPWFILKFSEKMEQKQQQHMEQNNPAFTVVCNLKQRLGSNKDYAYTVLLSKLFVSEVFLPIYHWIEQTCHLCFLTLCIFPFSGNLSNKVKLKVSFDGRRKRSMEVHSGNV